MAILDWFKEVPLSAVFKEKLVGLENENATLRSKNAILKASLSQKQDKKQTIYDPRFRSHSI